MKKNVLYLGLDPSSYLKQVDVTLLHLPLIRIVPYSSDHPTLQSTFQQFSHYTHVIMTSKTTVKLMLQHLSYFGYSLADWQAKKTCAVGQVTASHLKQVGVDPWMVAQEETSEGLVEALPIDQLQEAWFFWPHSAQSRSVITDFLVYHRIRFEACALYETHSIIHAHLPSLEAIDEIIFTSPSTVDAFLQNFGKLPIQKQLTAIGPITENYLKSRLA